MTRSKLFLSTFAVALAGSAAAAQQAAPAASPQQPAAAAPAQQPGPAATATTGFAAGAKVTDTAGGEVGMIVREDGAFVILKTDKHEVRLPKTSFTPHNGAFLMAMTRDQVNTAVEQAMAEANKLIAPGATVTGSGGATVGTIDSVDGEFVTLKLTSGKLVRLPRTGVAPGPNGAVIGMSAAELEAAAAGASASQAGAEAQ